MISSTARASFKGAYTIETLFAATGGVLGSKQILAGGFDAAKTAIVENTPYTLISAAQAASLFGFGSQLHRMAIYFFKMTKGSVPCIAFPLPAAESGAAATKTVTFATNVSSAGTFYIRAGGYLTEELITIAAAVDDTPTEIAALLVAAVTALPNLPFTATNSEGVVTLTAKTLDITSESLKITVNHKASEALELPGGMTAVVANGITGVGTSSLAGLFTYMTGGDVPWYTNVVHPYTSAAALNSAVAAIGEPNDQSGLYDILDYRPAVVYSVDTTGGSAGLTAALALGDARKETDCVNCRIEAPSYPELSHEIASYISGAISMMAQGAESASEYVLNFPALYGPITKSDDWTTSSDNPTNYANIDLAVQAGVTPLIYKNGLAYFEDVVTFWHPADNQNAPFKYVVNQRKIWNVQNLTNIYLNGPGLKGKPIVGSVAAVKQSAKAIDADVILAGLAQLAGIFAEYGWIYDAEFTIKNTTVTVSGDNPDRFDIVMPIIASGNNRISNAEIQVDRNIDAVDIRLVA